MAKTTKRANDYYMGIRGVHFIWHGQWSDPELRYKKDVANYWDVEEGLWASYKEECKDAGEEPTDTGFASWCKDNAQRVKDDISLSAYLARGGEI